MCRPLFIPSSVEWLAIVSGALTELTQVWNWEQFGAVTPDEAVARMQQMVAAYYDEFCSSCVLPDGDSIIRVNQFGELEQFDGSDWIAPTGDYELPPYEARTEPTADERRCLAAANAANVLEQLYEEVSDKVQEGLTLAEIGLAVVGLISAIINPVVGLITNAIFAFSLTLLKFIVEAVQYISDDVWDTSFNDGLRCLFYACASDASGVVTFDYDCVVEGLYAATLWSDPTGFQQRLAGQIVFLLNWIGVEGLNLAGETTAITTADCADCTYWAREEDFGSSMWGWEIGAYSGEDLAEYTPPFDARVNFELPGIGWGTFLVIRKYMNLPGFCRWEIDYEWEQGVIGSGTPPGHQFLINGGVVSETFGDGSFTQAIDISGYTVPGFVEVNFLVSLVPTATADGFARVTKMRWYGQGTPPDIGVEIDPDPSKCDFP